MTVKKDTLAGNLHHSKTTKLGFPRVEDWDGKYRFDQEKYLLAVRDNMIDMDDPNVSQSIKDEVEFTVDMSRKREHLLELNVRRNETRAQELIKIRKEVLAKAGQNSEVDIIDQNLLIFYVDALSRPNLERMLPKFNEYLGQFVHDDEDSQAFQYFRYHSVRFNTYKNNHAMYFGVMGNFEDDTKNVFQYFSDNGFVTALARDQCEMESIDPPGDITGQSAPMYRWDHYAATIGCDANFDKMSNKHIDWTHGRNSVLRHCIYGQEMHDIALDYISQFWKAYPDVNKFMRIHLSDAHENTGELIKYADDSFVRFFKDFQEKGHLIDTQVMIIADHGPHFFIRHIPIIPDDSRAQEMYTPLLIHLAPKSTPNAYLENLENNQQNFLNSHDIYATLKSFATGTQARSPAVDESYSYLYDDMPNGRQCTNTNIFYES
jgi:hypothetical protein